MCSKSDQTAQDEAHERLTREALAAVDAGFTFDHQVVQEWAESLGTDRQDFAQNIARVIAAIRSPKPDADDKEVAYLLKNYPLSDFDQKTAFELIEAGRADDVVAYLESSRAGFVG